MRTLPTLCLLLLCMLFLLPTSILWAQNDFQDGFFPMKYDAESGKLHLNVPKSKLNTDFLYVNSLQAGIGSNDIGLDRGQLGDTRIVRFEQHGNKLLLLQPNLSYRATTTNPMEKLAMDEAFAQSVLWGFEIQASNDEAFTIDLTTFLMQDAHGISQRLASMGEGSYRVDASRSAVYAPMTKNFPKNTEMEALLTYVGQPKGRWLRSVTPSAEAITVRLHHSFVELPEPGYEPRTYDPRSGYFGRTWYDYATEIDQPTAQKVINRHRLVKKDPSAPKSEVVEPIVYYLDPGTPEPVRSALLEGASWWNEAFEAAGYIDAFQVKMMPEDADPMDVRYNVIQWVHRSTRGWSYGASVTDPRTGEIIKGKVTLGSLRVRQDFLIANGLLGAYSSEENRQKALDLALARLRQLSAHEVGHTLGLAHNYSSSVNNRASVMDYPHPLFGLTEAGQIDLTQAYDTGIGEWDKMSIRYGYESIPDSVDEGSYLRAILAEAEQKGLLYLTDQDARPAESPSSTAHLWDNGENAATELQRMIGVREHVIQNFDIDRLPDFAPLSTLEEAYVPMYLMHRYQVEAAAKSIGGVDYQHEMKLPGKAPEGRHVVPSEQQELALSAILATLSPSFLDTPDRLIRLFGARAPSYGRDRESFQSAVGLLFDPIAAAESAADQSLRFLLHPQRLNRVDLQMRNGEGLQGGVSGLLKSTSEYLMSGMKASTGRQELIAMHTFALYLDYLNHALYHRDSHMGSRQAIRNELQRLKQGPQFKNNEIGQQIDAILEGKHKDERPRPARIPDGSPIGSGLRCEHPF